MKTRIYYNTTNVPVIIDGEGRSIGGGEWVPAERNDEIRRALDQRLLVEIEPDENVIENDGPAAAAHKVAIEANRETETVSSRDTATVQDKDSAEQVGSDSEQPSKSTSRKTGKKQER